MMVPFTYDSVESELLDKKLVISRNKAASNVFKAVAEVTLEASGEATGAEGWLVNEGVLKVDMGAQKGFYEFRGIESRNGVVYAVGSHNAEMGGDVRFTMHKKIAVEDSFGICISSHVKYEKETLPVILKSLRKAGFDSARVTAVVGGCKDTQDGQEEDVEGVRAVRSSANAMGFTALGEASSGDNQYWMLLHDTCTVDRDFTEKASAIDIGLNPDVVLFSGLEEGVELGLYSSKYMEKGVVELDARVDRMLGEITRDASVVVEGISETVKEGDRDVYGGGTIRKIMAMKSVGVKKNVRKLSKKRP